MSTRETSASLVQTDSAPPLVPRTAGIAKDVAKTDRQDFLDHPRHVEFLGLPFCLWTQAEVVQAIMTDRGGPYRYVVTPNAYHVVAAHDDPARLLPLYRAAWLSLCDSRIVRALARIDRLALPLVTGSDLVAALLANLNASGRTIAPRRILVVGPPRSTETRLRTAYPNLTFEVIPAPGALARNAELRLAVARACLTRTWDIALLCVGCPAQELVARQLAELGRKSGLALCVGASIDFLTGAQVRAPRRLQRLGLEWAYRLVREPRRLWRRYLVESPRILGIFLASVPIPKFASFCGTLVCELRNRKDTSK